MTIPLYRRQLPRRISSCGLALLIFLHSEDVLGQTPAVQATHAMVVSAESSATAAGVAVLRSGGNAIDVAVAVGFALAVTYPEAGNIGGGGFMVIRLANGRSTMIDFRERAPFAATRDMYLDSIGIPVPQKSLVGPLAAGVPGSVAGLLKALELYGTKSRSEVMKDAIALAENGIVVSERFAASLQESFPLFVQFPATMRLFSRDNVALKKGDIFRQPELAATLRAIQKEGRKGFYEGRVAERIIAGMERHGGLITRADLQSYEAIERQPIVGSYRGFEIITSAPPSAGGITLLEMLNILEGFDLRASGWNSARTAHLIAAAAQRAFADRGEYIGDPDVVRAPVDRLISKEYARFRAIHIDTVKATPSAQIRAGTLDDLEKHHTTNYCVVDGQGNAVSVSVTLNDSYGCKSVVEGAGFLLNNEMDDFVAKPGSPNLYGLIGGEANTIAPGKRMLSSMTPTIVLKSGKPFLIVGGRGGGRIPTAVAQVIMNVIDHGMGIAEAVNAPRIHHQWLPDELLVEPHALHPEALAKLLAMGYVLRQSQTPVARTNALLIESGRCVGGPDAREGGVAAGY